MASLATFTPTTIKGLAGSSIAGTKLNLKSSRQILNPHLTAGAVVAKYGDKSVYFDLEDLGNTTGEWDVYGSDAPSPYNPLQVFDLLPYRPHYPNRNLVHKSGSGPKLVRVETRPG
ncbi:putative photosystem I PsaH, reaction centre subunit VI [Helianthus anomalus]